MIPIAVFGGALAAVFGGRRAWWLVAVAAIVWPILLVLADVQSPSDALAFGGAGVLAAVNTAIGVLVGLGLRFAADFLRRPLQR